MQSVRQAVLRIAVLHQARHGIHQSAVQIVAQCGKMLRGVRQPRTRQPRRLANADYLRHVLGAGPQAVLLIGAKENRFDRGAAPNVERADTLGPKKTCDRRA